MSVSSHQNCDRNRHRDINPYHADLNIITKVTCRLTVTGVDAGTIAILVIIDQLHGLFHAIDQQDRAEVVALAGEGANQKSSTQFANGLAKHINDPIDLFFLDDKGQA